MKETVGIIRRFDFNWVTSIQLFMPLVCLRFGIILFFICYVARALVLFSKLVEYYWLFISGFWIIQRYDLDLSGTLNNIIVLLLCPLVYRRTLTSKYVASLVKSIVWYRPVDIQFLACPVSNYDLSCSWKKAFTLKYTNTTSHRAHFSIDKRTRTCYVFSVVGIWCPAKSFSGVGSSRRAKFFFWGYEFAPRENSSFRLGISGIYSE